jgi:hypothetical protein
MEDSHGTFFTLDRYVIKVNRIVSLIVIGYNEDTQIYFKREFLCVDRHLDNIKYVSESSEWRDDWRSSCDLKLVRNCGNTSTTINGTNICHLCYAFYKSARNITDDEYNKYIRSLLEYSSNIKSSFANDNNYIILASSSIYNIFISIYVIELIQIQPYISKCDNSQITYEYSRRKYIRRILMFAQSDLIKDIIIEIAYILIRI